jgi:hypothetical protein
MEILAAALLGIVCHQAFMQPFEVDSYGWEMVIAYLSMLGSVLVGFVLSTNLGLASATLRTSSVGAAFLAGLYGSMLLYRTLFHRLGRFPGPFAARLSNLYQYVFLCASLTP